MEITKEELDRAAKAFGAVYGVEPGDVPHPSSYEITANTIEEFGRLVVRPILLEDIASNPNGAVIDGLARDAIMQELHRRIESASQVAEGLPCKSPLAATYRTLAEHPNDLWCHFTRIDGELVHDGYEKRQDDGTVLFIPLFAPQAP